MIPRMSSRSLLSPSSSSRILILPRQQHHYQYSTLLSSSSTTTNSSSQLPPPPPHNPGRSLSRRLLWSTGLISLGLLSGYSLAVLLPRPRLVSLLFPVPTPYPPPKGSPEEALLTQEIEDSLQFLPIVKQLRAMKIADPSSSSSASALGGTSLTGEATGSTALIPAYTESRPYSTSTPGPHSLSAYTLRGPGKFAVAPLVFTSRAKTEGIFVMHFGGGLCGHEGVIHGGLLATVLDESMGRTAFFSLPNMIGVTATLTVKYRKPTFANQFVVIRTETVRKDGRKVWIKGTLEDLKGVVLVESEALFVEPKGAKFLKSSTVREALK